MVATLLLNVGFCNGIKSNYCQRTDFILIESVINLLLRVRFSEAIKRVISEGNLSTKSFFIIYYFQFNILKIINNKNSLLEGKI